MILRRLLLLLLVACSGCAITDWNRAQDLLSPEMRAVLRQAQSADFVAAVEAAKDGREPMNEFAEIGQVLRDLESREMDAAMELHKAIQELKAAIDAAVGAL